MKVLLGQINPIVGDIDGNTRRVLDVLDEARRRGAALAILPELCLIGYPPRDLLLRHDFILRNVEAVERVAEACRDLTVIVGFAQPIAEGTGTGIHNSAAACSEGRVQQTYAKCLLPTYDVFDESRYFTPGRTVRIATVPAGAARIRVGLTICEDLWNDAQFGGRPVYGLDPIAATARAGADLIVNISASPFENGKHAERERLFAAQVRRHGVPLLYCAQVGGNDDLLFDGVSMAFNGRGELAARAKPFEEDLLLVDTDEAGPDRIEPYQEGTESLWRAVVLGTRDYVRKCGFSGVVLGLSGGVDSAVAAAIAVDALGVENVHGAAMPSRFSSPHSLEDAGALARNLGIDFRVLPIAHVHSALEQTLSPSFEGRTPDVTEENLQARIRGNLLMALSNKFGWLLLATSNKSELAVGYCTLYGDMCGGFAPLSDVPKTGVYELARYFNARHGRDVIPRSTLLKPPSAELRENQTDQDSLPPYDVLDAILERYVERDECVEEIVRAGFDRATVQRVARMVARSEHKRTQAALGIKVTSRAFGAGRRMPVAARTL
ncbi:MAG: NAD+ synthase [Phycisphaerales bacterium]|nr:NAD+ synthase [Phycisphaerales bacterium]